MATERKHVVERVQTGVRMEKRLLKVLRAFADFNDITLGDLLEGIVLHAFDGKCPFSKNSLERIRELKKFYGLELDSSASHLLIETGAKKVSCGETNLAKSRPEGRLYTTRTAGRAMPVKSAERFHDR